MRKEEFSGKKGAVVAAIDRHSPFACKGVVYKRTVRSTSCSLLVPKNNRCVSCFKHRKTLNKQLSRENRIRPVVSGLKSKFGPKSSMDTPGRTKKLHQLAAKQKVLKQRIRRLQSAISQSVESCGVVVSDGLHNDMIQIMDDNSLSVEEDFPAGSFQYVQFHYLPTPICIF